MLKLVNISDIKLSVLKMTNFLINFAHINNVSNYSATHHFRRCEEKE